MLIPKRLPSPQCNSFLKIQDPDLRSGPETSSAYSDDPLMVDALRTHVRTESRYGLDQS